MCVGFLNVFVMLRGMTFLAHGDYGERESADFLFLSPQFFELGSRQVIQLPGM